MNHTQATRKIRVGSHWMNSEEEVVIEKVTKRDVYYKTTTGSGLASVWWFRENFCPGRLKKTKKKTGGDARGTRSGGTPELPLHEQWNQIVINTMCSDENPAGSRQPLRKGDA